MNLVKKTGLMAAGVGLVMMSQIGLAAPPPPSGTVACNDFKSDCAGPFDVLCAAIDGASSLSTRDRNGMVGKVNEADNKVDVKKYEDADQKLDNIGDKLDELYWARKQKVSDTDFATISDALNGTEGAHACVADLMTK